MTELENAEAEALLAEIIDRYLNSDFNGLFITAGDARGEATRELLRSGSVEVISEEDFPNPHIRPWASRRSQDQQLASVSAAIAGESYGVCLYPLAAVLEGRTEVSRLGDRPYTQRLAAGAGQLDIAYFRMDVLESYRNDPRFSFRFDDVGAKAVVTDAVYMDDSEPEADKVSIRLGFAYRHPPEEGGPIVRCVAAFIHDLHLLSPEHQRRWQTYEVAAEGLEPHPIWLAEAMGHWVDYVGPFEALFAELDALNELFARAFGTPLFRQTERPDDFGWILRPSQAEYDGFIQTLDKVLSDNLRHRALDAAGIERNDESGQAIGTINRLDRLLERASVSNEERASVLKPLREIRTARQAPAHALRANVTDANLVRRQAELLQAVTHSIGALRRFWQTHPANRDWEAPDGIEKSKRLWL